MQSESVTELDEMPHAKALGNYRISPSNNFTTEISCAHT